MKNLLSIVEMGGYPDFSPLYRELGYLTGVQTTMRKALSYLKNEQPDVIVAEFNFQSDFRDRSSSLESLLAVVQRLPGLKVIVFYDQEYSSQFDKLAARLPVYAGLAFPVNEAELRDCLASIRDGAH